MTTENVPCMLNMCVCGEPQAICVIEHYFLWNRVGDKKLSVESCWSVKFETNIE